MCHSKRPASRGSDGEAPASARGGVSRRRFLQGGAAGAAMALGAFRSVRGGVAESPGPNAGEPIALGDARHLFTDDRLVDAARTRDAARTLNPPVDVQRILAPRMPWESLGFIFYSTVIEDEKEVKLYYGSYGWDGRIQRHFCLATSSDGVHFERARLGAKVYDGKSVETNFMLPTAVEVGVFLDPHTTSPDARYRMVYSAGGIEHPDRGGLYTATSADGVRWTKNPTRLLPFIPDSQHTAYWDDRLGKYVVYLRAWGPRGREVCRTEVADIDQPWPFDAAAPPRYHWGKDKTPTLGRQFPIVMAPDDADPENLDIYTNVVTPYPYAANAVFAFPAVYFKFTGPDWKERALSGNDGNFEVQLAASADGVAWNRWRQPYLAAGHYGDLDLRLVSMARGMVRRGRWLHQYFVGWPHTHGRPNVWDRDPADGDAWTRMDKGGIYLARQRLDGFLSIDGAYSGAVLTTKPATFVGGQLRLNLDTRGSGVAKVALLDADGAAIPGFSAADCAAINADATDQVVRWKHGTDVSALQGKPVRLQIEMRNTKLYALQFAPSTAADAHTT